MTINGKKTGHAASPSTSSLPASEPTRSNSAQRWAEIGRWVVTCCGSQAEVMAMHQRAEELARLRRGILQAVKDSRRELD